MYHNELCEGAPLKVWSADSKEYYGAGILKGYFHTWRVFNKVGRVLVPTQRILLMDGPNEGKEIMGGYEGFFHTMSYFHRLMETGGITDTQKKAMEQISPFKRDGYLAIGQLFPAHQNTGELHDVLFNLVTTAEYPVMCLYHINFKDDGLDQDFILATNVPGLDILPEDRKSIIKEHFIYSGTNELITSTVGWIQQDNKVKVLETVSV